MDAFADKAFTIALAADPNAWAGANNRDNSAVKPVVTHGEMKKWSCKDGCLVLDDAWFCSREGDKLIVIVIRGECTTFELVAASPAVYQIRLPGTDLAWTATSFDPENPIILAPFGSVDPKFQTWVIILDE